MASKYKSYNPWPDKKKIGQLLQFDSDATAYEQLLWRQRYGSGGAGFRGCPYCHANPQLMGLGKKAPSTFPYMCKKCGHAISPTFNTPMYNSKIPLPVWFDCMYYLMNGYKTERAPYIVQGKVDTKLLQERYNLSRHSAQTLKFGARNLVCPYLGGMWGDEPKSMQRENDAFRTFESALKAVVNVPPMGKPKHIEKPTAEKPFIDVDGRARKYMRDCKNCGREFATDIIDRWYCNTQCKETAENKTKRKVATA